MKREMKGVLTALWLGLGLTGAREAVAASTDSLTVTITPNALYAVSINTASVVLDLGGVNLGASTQTVSPATVTIQSSYAGTDLKLQGSIAPGVAPWSFSADSTTLENDKLAAWAVFTDLSVSAAPGQTSGYFNGTAPGTANDMIDGTSQDVGAVSGVGTGFLAGTSDAGYKTMQAIPNYTTDQTASRSHLWLYFRLPGGTTSSAAQKITVTLFAGAPN